MPRYDEVFGSGDRGYRGGQEGGYDAQYTAETPWGPPLHSPNQRPRPGETDFLGRPYTSGAMEDLPWGLINAERMHHRREYDRGYRGRPMAGRYDRGYRGYDSSYRGHPRAARYGGDYGPAGYHPRFMPDSDVAGMDAHRLHHGPMRHTSDWTRWF